MCVFAHSARDSKELFQRAIFCHYVPLRVQQGELETRTSPRLPQVKALWVSGGGIPPAGFTPRQNRPCLKASWIQERGKKHKSKNRAVREGENIHRCSRWVEWKII